MNRSTSPDWYSAVESTYFLYPVHVSLSFLFSPTLSSSLYLLLLRFLHRAYNEVFRLAATIGTDVEFSAEEDCIFQCLGRPPHGDRHPDAHACRLKIALVVLDSPVQCPFDLTSEASRYVTKLNHVSAVCRLSLSEELQLLEMCVCDAQDPRFFQPVTQKPLYSLFEVTVVKNRRSYLRALLQGQRSAEVFTVPRETGTRWAVERNLSAVMLDQSSVMMGLSVSYSAPVELSDHATLQVAGKLWGGQEDMAGHAHHLGFLFLYELLTGTKHVKLLSTDVSASFAVLMFELMSDKAESSLLASIVSLLCRFPQLRAMVPRYHDSRQQKKVQVSAIGDDVDPVSPLGSLLSGVMAVLEQEMADLLVDPPEYSDKPAPTPSACSVNLRPWQALQQRERIAAGSGDSVLGGVVGGGAWGGTATEVGDDGELSMTGRSRHRMDSWIIPSISNFSCAQRLLSEITASASTTELSTGGTHASASSQSRISSMPIPAGLNMGTGDIELFAAQPLSCLDVGRYVCQVTRAELEQEAVAAGLPFDVALHGQAQSAIAKSMLKRLTVDTAEFATLQNSGLTPKLRFLLPFEETHLKVKLLQQLQQHPQQGVHHLEAGLQHMQEQILSTQAILDELVAALDQLRATDSHYVETALPWLIAAANAVPTAHPQLQSGGMEMELSDGGDGSHGESTGASSASTGADGQPGADRETLLFLLKRFSRQEVTLWLEFLFGTLLSSAQTLDLTVLNPFLSAAAVQSLSAVLVASILHANRVGMVNRCAADGRDLQRLLRLLSSAVSTRLAVLSAEIASLQQQQLAPEALRSNGAGSFSAWEWLLGSGTGAAKALASVLLKGESLARNLTVGRHYVDPVRAAGATQQSAACPATDGGSRETESGGDTTAGSGSDGSSGGDAVWEESGGEKKKRRRSADLVYDPRFLLFEFTW